MQVQCELTVCWILLFITGARIYYLIWIEFVKYFHIDEFQMPAILMWLFLIWIFLVVQLSAAWSYTVASITCAFSICLLNTHSFSLYTYFGLFCGLWSALHNRNDAHTKIQTIKPHSAAGRDFFCLHKKVQQCSVTALASSSPVHLMVNNKNVLQYTKRAR